MHASISDRCDIPLEFHRFLFYLSASINIASAFPGIILSGNEISQILLSLILTYFGGQRNRPRWIAWGVVFSAMSCFILAWPHFIYGPGEEALQYTKEYLEEHKVSLVPLFNSVQ